MAIKKEVVTQNPNPIISEEQQKNLTSQGFTLDQITAVVAAAVGQTIESLGLKKTNPDEDAIGRATQAVRPEDVLADPVLFYAPAMTFIITGIHHDGVVDPLPHGHKAIVFKFEAAKMLRGGKEQNIRVTSRYVCTTKPMLEALRKDFRYGALFWEGDAKSAFNVDTKITERLIAYLTSYSKKDAGAVFTEALGLGIKTKGASVQDIKMKLATYYARQEYESEIKRSADRVVGAEKSALVTKGNEKPSVNVTEITE